MKHHNRVQALSLVTAIGFILSGCGGGGGSSAPAPTPSPTPTPATGVLALTANNYQDFSLLFNRSLFNDVSEMRTAYHTPSNDMHRLAQTLWLTPGIIETVNTQFIKALPTSAGTQACAVSGNMVRTLVDTNNDGLITQTGESVTLTFNQCKDSTATVNGSIAYSLGSVTTTRLAATLTYNAMTLTQTDGTHSYTGVKALSIDTATGLDVMQQVSSDAIVVNTYATNSDRGVQKAGYQTRYQETGTDWSVSLSGGVQLQVNNDVANLTLATQIPIAGSLNGTNYSLPRTGEYSTQWNSQGLKTTSNADGLLTMSGDINADGVYELSYQLSWDRLVIPE